MAWEKVYKIMGGSILVNTWLFKKNSMGGRIASTLMVDMESWLHPLPEEDDISNPD